MNRTPEEKQIIKEQCNYLKRLFRETQLPVSWIFTSKGTSVNSIELKWDAKEVQNVIADLYDKLSHNHCNDDFYQGWICWATQLQCKLESMPRRID